MTLEQLKFLNELLATPGLAVTREKWRIAAETESALAQAIREASAAPVRLDSLPV